MITARERRPLNGSTNTPSRVSTRIWKYSRTVLESTPQSRATFAVVDQLAMVEGERIEESGERRDVARQPFVEHFLLQIVIDVAGECAPILSRIVMLRHQPPVQRAQQVELRDLQSTLADASPKRHARPPSRLARPRFSFLALDPQSTNRTPSSSIRRCTSSSRAGTRCTSSMITGLARTASSSASTRSASVQGARVSSSISRVSRRSKRADPGNCMRSNVDLPVFPRPPKKCGLTLREIDAQGTGVENHFVNSFRISLTKTECTPKQFAPSSRR